MIYKIYAESFSVNVLKFKSNDLSDILSNNINHIDDLDRKKIKSFIGIAFNPRLGIYIESEDNVSHYYTMGEILEPKNDLIEDLNKDSEFGIGINKLSFSYFESNLIC